MRNVLVKVYSEDQDETVYLVAVDDEKVWEDTRRYLEDCGEDLEIVEYAPVTPGELSDMLAPRDE